MHRRIALIVLSAGLAAAQPRAINVTDSILTIHVYKAGVFGAFGHDHDIRAPLASGNVDTVARLVELHVASAALRVIDAKASDKDRSEIQKTMLGPEVLDVERFSEIAFRSTSAEPAGPNSWRLSGDLTLHGQTRPITMNVAESAGRFTGQAVFKQSAFGIKPVRVAGGTIKVKDEIRIDFDIHL